ncbi:MAG: single-stranded-DNA-specific exonuclease RecJ [Bauldia sp.]|nr:single-stranded-DNA-specific exonuclease RecJ [Bauldia sp.]MCW5719053.1 single-stranded-DNA-specific exonuclease RecJ [Bauldia sp.]
MFATALEEALSRHAAAPSPAFLGVERSVTGRRWVERLDARTADAAIAIAQRNDLPELLARILAGRGVTAESAADFLDPTVRRLMPDPSALTDMDAAAARIADAVRAKETVAIFGDYDVDGATSAALLTRFLRASGLAPTIYIPDRLFEGYGPNREAVERLVEGGATLIVTVDCGTTSIDALARAHELGADVVVLDHHLAGAELPPAVAIVNPNREDDISGLGHLAAVGIVFMTLVAVNRELRRRGHYQGLVREPDLLQWLDLVALGTVCDVVGLTGLNRAFVVKGLIAIARGGNPGLAALGRASRLDGPIAAHHLGFMLGPRINAGGRIGNAALGSRLLSLDDPVEAEAIAAELDRLNGERQAIEAGMLAEALAAAEPVFATEPHPSVLITHSAGWHQGVVGLIAARLRERFGRPAFAVAVTAGGYGVGSGRSIHGVDLGRAVRAAAESGLLVKGGGHAMAAGITIAMDRLPEFEAFLTEALQRQVVDAAETERALVVDAALSADGATLETIAELERAGPFGAGHPEPVLAFPAHRIAYAEIVSGNHVRASIATAGGTMLKAMAFRAAETPLGRRLLARDGGPLHVAGTVSADHWQGRSRPSLRILDVADAG